MPVNRADRKPLLDYLTGVTDTYERTDPRYGAWTCHSSHTIMRFVLDSVYVPQAEKVTDKAPVVKRKADDDTQQQKRPRPEGLWSTVDDLRTDLECFVRSQTRAANMFLPGSAKRKLKVDSLIQPLLE